MSKVTIEDISRHTGLSRGTVSRALNDRPDISRATKDKVLEACRQLSYVPSHAARSLATGRRYALAVVVDDLGTGFATTLLRGILARAREAQYAVHVAEIGADAEQTVEHLCADAHERVDTILVAATLSTDLARRLTEALDMRPMVACTNWTGAACDVFSPDQTESGRLVGRHILRAHTPDVVYVHETGSRAADLRLAGFQEVCRERGIDPQQVVVQIAPDGMERLEPLRERIRTARAVAASNDYLAAELMMLCRALGRTPAQDISIIGQGNEIVSTRIAPKLTTTDLCGEEIGQRAVDIALQRIMKTRQDAPQQTQVAPMLITRETTRLL